MKVKDKSFFENLPDLIKPNAVAKLLGVNVHTIYSWRHFLPMNKIPKNLFLRIGRGLYIRKDILKQWIISQNPSFTEGAM